MKTKNNFIKFILSLAKKDFYLAIPFIPFSIIAESLLAILLPITINFLFKNVPRINLTDLLPFNNINQLTYLNIMFDRKDLALFIPLLLCTLGLIKMISTFFSTYFIEKSGYRIIYKLRFQLLNHYLLNGSTLLYRENTDEIANKIIADTALLQNAFSKGIISFTRDLCVLFISFIVCLFMLKQYFFILIIIFLPLVFFINKIIFKLNYYNNETLKRQINLSTRMLQTKKGILSIFITNTEKHEIIFFNKQINDYYQQMHDSFFIRIIFRPFMEFLVYFFIVILLIVKFNFHINAEFIFSTIIIVSFLFPKIKNLGSFANQWTEIKLTFNRLFEQWHKIDFIKNIPIITAQLNNNLILKTNNLSYFGNDNIQILKDINIEIKKGEKIALVGESGSGKTTFLRLCAGIFNAQSGELYIEKNNLLATQEPYIFKGLIAENIIYNSNSIPNNLDKEIEQLLLQLKLAHSTNTAHLFANRKIGFSGEGLSGGEKARISLGRILFANPKLLLLDEPTANLDYKSALLFWKAVEHWLQKNKENTVIAVIHIVDIENMWDKAYLFSNGHIKKVGKIQDLWNKTRENQQEE